MKLRDPFVLLLTGLVALLVLAAFPATSSANHSWGGYHWARTANPFTLKLGDNVSGPWDSVLATTSSDWTQSTVLNTTIVAGGTRPRNCRPTSGRVEVCNASYGNNGWLGIAQIWLTGGVHITQGTTKVNDYYFSQPQYNTTAWRNLVMCQEVGHTFGLDHQDEDFNNPPLGTCMDYTNDPTPNQHPNAHDYDELQTIYAHLDSFNSWSRPFGGPAGWANGTFDTPADWGKVVETTADGHPSLFVRDFGGGFQVVTHVTWAR